MPQLHCAAREIPGALVLGGCRQPQQGCKAGRVSWLAVCFLPGLLNWPGRVIFFLSLFLSVTSGFLPLSMDGLHSNASHYSFILTHGKLWKLGRTRKGAQAIWEIFSGIRFKAQWFWSVTFLFSPKPLRGESSEWDNYRVQTMI